MLFLLLAVCYYFYFLQQNRKPENKDLQNIVIKQENLKNE